MRLLPFTARPSPANWGGFPYRMPAVITSDDRPHDKDWARTMLESLANTFVSLRQELRQNLKRPSQAAYRVADSAVRRFRNDFKAVGVSKVAGASIDQIVGQALAALEQAMQRPPTRRDDPVRDWYLENLLSVWEKCGGATHSSVKGKGDEARGGKLIQFLQLACEPVFRRCGLKPLTPGAARGAVRKLLAERNSPTTSAFSRPPKPAPFR
jgi:hypothetical protein